MNCFIIPSQMLLGVGNEWYSLSKDIPFHLKGKFLFFPGNIKLLLHHSVSGLGYICAALLAMHQ